MERNLQGVDLRNETLRGANLKDVDLSEANLAYTHFIRAESVEDNELVRTVGDRSRGSLDAVDTRPCRRAVGCGRGIDYSGPTGE